MIKYNRVIYFSLILYIGISLAAGIAGNMHRDRQNGIYRIEINRIMEEISRVISEENLSSGKNEYADSDMNKDSEKDNIPAAEKAVKSVNLSKYTAVKKLEYLSAKETDREKTEEFYREKNNTKKAFLPLYEGNTLIGYVGAVYTEIYGGDRNIIIFEAGLAAMEIMVMGVLLYLKSHLIKPFNRINEMTYELSKGNFSGDIKEDKNRYLGNFLWGIGQLKDELYVSRKRELELLKEKKTLLLSLSHDIKTPLNMIKLYGKALEENMYSSKGERMNVYRHIGEKTVQIENYVNEIVKASREDIIHIEVEQGEFYIKAVIDRVKKVYGEKCAIRQCEFSVGEYGNRLVRGDENRLFEVFENIFENAFKYGDGRKIEMTFSEEDGCLLTRIFNTGESVAENDFNHLFDSFFRGGNICGQRGNGLGLYICREIMRKMGGEIYAEKEEEGMAFVVVMPVNI